MCLAWLTTSVQRKGLHQCIEIKVVLIQCIIWHGSDSALWLISAIVCCHTHCSVHVYVNLYLGFPPPFLAIM